MSNKFRTICIIGSLLALTGCLDGRPVYHSTFTVDYYLTISTSCGRYGNSTCVSLHIGPNTYGEFDFPCQIVADKQVSNIKFGTVDDAMLTIYEHDSSDVVIPEKTLTKIYGELCTEMAIHGNLTQYIKDNER